MIEPRNPVVKYINQMKFKLYNRNDQTYNIIAFNIN